MTTTHRAPEIVFQPPMVGVDQCGVSDTIEYILQGYPPDVQQRLAENVFVTGGNSLFPGFVERLEVDIRTMRPFQSKFNVFAAGRVCSQMIYIANQPLSPSPPSPPSLPPPLCLQGTGSLMPGGVAAAGPELAATEGTLSVEPNIWRGALTTARNTRRPTSSLLRLQQLVSHDLACGSHDHACLSHDFAYIHNYIHVCTYTIT